MSSTVGLYIHFPWCLAKCPYCDFLSLAAPDPSHIPQTGYTDAVLRELTQRRELVGDHKVHSVFFGGGTPSLWSSTHVAQVLTAIRTQYELTPDVEITLEANPTSFSVDKGRDLLSAGVNRLSIGVQGLDIERLRFLGRWHAPDGALKALDDALESGIDNVSADLIYGVYRQPPDVALGEALAIAARGVSHLSAYLLTVEPGTSFGAQQRKGKLPLLDEASVASSFEAVHGGLTQAGFDHYEISNFARRGRTSRHNLGYWRGQPYLGIGLGAFGTVMAADNGETADASHNGARYIRYRNTTQVERYLAMRSWPLPTEDAAGSGKSYHQVEPVAPPTALAERLMLGLRLREGVDAMSLEREFENVWPTKRPLIERLLTQGRLEVESGRLRIPYTHWLFADGVVAELV